MTMDDKVFYANAVSASVSNDEALLVFKLGWPDLTPEEAQEICRIYVPRHLLRSILKEWPIKIGDVLESKEEGVSPASEEEQNAD
jgi:hypothetical protein